MSDRQYRAERRNAAKGAVWRGIRPSTHLPLIDRSSPRKDDLWPNGYPRSSERERARRRRQLSKVEAAS